VALFCQDASHGNCRDDKSDRRRLTLQSTFVSQAAMSGFQPVRVDDGKQSRAKNGT